MKIQLMKTPFEHVIIDDMYTDDELKLIWREIEFLTPKMWTPETALAAMDENGYKKTAKGIPLDVVYAQRSVSDILTLNRKWFDDEVVSELVKCHPFYGFMEICNSDTTLLNCYRDGDYYRSHRDLATLSAVTFFVTEGVTGGDFHFTDHNNYTIESKNNRAVIFPSAIRHSVDVVHTQNETQGRYSMAQFFSMRYQ